MSEPSLVELRAHFASLSRETRQDHFAGLHSELQHLDRTYHLAAAFAPTPEDGGELLGPAFTAKDNLCSAGLLTRAGSRILEGYVPPFDAEAIARLKTAGGVLLAKTTMDEFGFGTFAVNSAHGIPRNPYDPARCAGGSSGGAGVATALLAHHLALAVSTGGSITCPAAFCGVLGLTPTYGRVSRWGLIDFANSLDKIGLMGRSVAALWDGFALIHGPDQKDPTSQAVPLAPKHEEPIERIVVPRNLVDRADPAIGKAFWEAVKQLESAGLTLVEAELPLVDEALAAYYLIACAEASTNLARYCGMRYGKPGADRSQEYNEYFAQVRSDAFGTEAKRRILLGTFARMAGFRDRYYLRALGVRTALLSSAALLFRQGEVLASPSMPRIAPRFDELERMTPLDAYLSDVLTVPANLAGLPHLSVPMGKVGGMPVGLQFIAPHWREDRLFEIGGRWTELRPPEFPMAAGAVL